MIQATELRIGNWVFSKNRVRKIISVSRSGILLLSGIGDSDVKDIYPIRLSKELLLEFGFSELHDGIYKHKHLTEVFHTLDEFFFRYDGKFISSCKYLHELQNIYFALYKAELKAIRSAVLALKRVEFTL